MARYRITHLFTFAALSAALSAPLSADLIGSDDFTYADGAIAGQAGGTSFDYNNINNTHTGTSSDWNNVFGASPSEVSGGLLVTEDDGVRREYDGASETDGAFRAVGVVYYSAEMTRTEGAGIGTGNTWGGLSSYDFGTERIFFGVRGGQGSSQVFGIQAGSAVNSAVVANNDQTYHLVAAVDFDNDQLRLWIDPDKNDFDYRGGGNSADLTLAYTATNWSTSLRLASGIDARTEWDNARIATTFAQAADLGIVFADNFSEADSTALNGKAPDAGGSWSGSPFVINANTVDTDPDTGTAFANFTRALGVSETLVLDFETLDSAGTFFSGDWGGISLYTGGSERVFIGDPSDTASGWGLRQSGLNVNTGINAEAISGKFTYAYNTGEYQFVINGALVAQGFLASNFAFDRIRIGTGGSDIAVSDLVVSFVVPAPAALPAGLGLIGLLAVRRRRRAG